MPDSLLQTSPDGLYCPAGNFYIDPWNSVDRAVITHAHSDHAKLGSNVYLTSGPYAHGDLAYSYEVSCREEQLHVRITQVGYEVPDRLLFAGTLEAACEFAATSN